MSDRVLTFSAAREFVFSTPQPWLWDWRRVLRDATWWGEGKAGMDDPRCVCPDVRMYLIDHCVRQGWHPYSRLRVVRKSAGEKPERLEYVPCGTFVMHCWEAAE